MTHKFLCLAGILLVPVVLATDRRASAEVKSAAECQAAGRRCEHQCLPIIKAREAQHCRNTCDRTMKRCVNRALLERARKQRDIELGKTKP
jgi:hypothetical protein